MERVLQTAFNKAYDSQEPSKALKSAGDDEEPPPDVVLSETQRILEAWEAKEYFKLLNLPSPTADAIGRPVWPCTNADVSKAFRKLSILVHPDKNPGEGARKAFEALTQAHRILKDPNKLEDILKTAAEKAKQEQERNEARASASERIQLNSMRLGQAKEMKKEEGEAFKNKILEQMQRRLAAAKKRRPTGSSRYARNEDENAGGGEGGGDEEQEEQQQEEDEEIGAGFLAARKKKKKVFL